MGCLISTIAVWIADLSFIKQQKQKSLNELWLVTRTEFLRIPEPAQCMLLLFCATCLCETALSAVIILKSKYQLSGDISYSSNI